MIIGLACRLYSGISIASSGSAMSRRWAALGMPAEDSRKSSFAGETSWKKRIVYCYEDEEVEVLKFIAHLLYRYDSVLVPNCYSFRNGQTVQSAILGLRRKLAGRELW